MVNKKSDLRNPNRALLRRVQRRLEAKQSNKKTKKMKTQEGFSLKNGNMNKSNFNILHDLDEDFEVTEKKTRLFLHNRRAFR